MHATAAPLLFLLATAPQDPAEVLARFKLDGKDAIVTRTDVAVEMAFHLRRRERGRQACEQLVDAALTRAAATKQGLLPTNDEIERFWQKLQEQLRNAGQRPEQFPAIRNATREQWFADLAVQIAQERLVRNELHLGADEPVTGEMLKLWLQEERKKRKVVTDPDALPAGTAVRIDDVDVTALDLGLLLLRIAEDGDRDRYVRQVALLQSIESLAHREGIAITPADLEAAVQKRRAEAAQDPQTRKVGFDQIVKAEGLTIEWLQNSRVFRSHVLLEKVGARRFSKETLAAELTQDRRTVLELVGPRRRLSIMFVRALDEPNGLVPLDFAAAEKRLLEARKRLAEESFDYVARVESQDPRTKQQGGDAGWHRRRSEQLPEAVLGAAFALDEGAVSQPVRTEEGVFLVKVVTVEPDPSDDELLGRLRAFRTQEMTKQILDDAAIEMVSKREETK